MNKMPTDESTTMTWLAHAFQSQFQTDVSTHDVCWAIIGWISFFFKLVSFAFIGPTLGLILFDFCLWIWRLVVVAGPRRSSSPSTSTSTSPSPSRTARRPNNKASSPPPPPPPQPDHDDRGRNYAMQSAKAAASSSSSAILSPGGADGAGEHRRAGYGGAAHR